jgi:SecD/SecF fusion protein
MPSAAFSQIVNRSMSEVIVRSLATSFCTMLPVLALFFFGGETLKDFAFALLIGTLSGTYSSVFIAGPVLTHWKEKEPVYATRYRRIREALGTVPAYAVATAGAPVDVEPAKKRREAVSLTAPKDPTQVSREEFDAMVRELGVEEEGPRRSQPAAAAAGRPVGGRRARSRAAGGGKGGQGGSRPAGDGGTPPAPGEGGGGPGGDSTDKPKKPRNRRHGRPR